VGLQSLTRGPNVSLYDPGENILALAGRRIGQRWPSADYDKVYGSLTRSPDTLRFIKALFTLVYAWFRIILHNMHAER
jgi:hypothetical protein